MIVKVPFSEDQLFLVEEHIFKNKRLYVHPDEYSRLTKLVSRRYSEHKIKEARINIEEGHWELDLLPVTVTT